MRSMVRAKSSLKRWPRASALVLSIAILALLAPATANTAASQAHNPFTSQPSNNFVQRFDGIPTEPTPWQPLDWDVSVHSRDVDTWDQPEPMEAEHGANCSPPPERHAIQSVDQAVYLCNGHMMTAINAGGYGVIYLTPNQIVDFSGGEAVVRFDVSTFRNSSRDWIDVWISPYDEQLVSPLETWLPDLNGKPRRGLHLKLGSNDNWEAHVISGFGDIDVSDKGWVQYGSFLTPSQVRRDTVEVRFSRTHLKVGMPAYNFWWDDVQFDPPLDWDSGVVQFGHHSYTPEKACDHNGTCHPGTWHWDNIEISPARPFTMIKANERFVDGTTPSRVTFDQPAPADARLRFAAAGSSVQMSTDNGASWYAATLQPQEKFDDTGFSSYFTPIPAGTSSVMLRATRGSWGDHWRIKDIAIWSLDTPELAATSDSPSVQDPGLLSMDEIDVTGHTD